MHIPVIAGLIKRRLLVNFRVDPAALEPFLPAPFKPKLQAGYAIAGICLIRLEQVRPLGLPPFLGLSSENAAHRIAVEWDGQEGVYIPRRDTGSRLNHLAGGRIFPGEHHLARFQVDDDGTRIDLRAESDGMRVHVQGRTAGRLPESSCFASLESASAFFEKGSLGYSATHDPSRLDGLTLKTQGWRVEPLDTERVESSFFAALPPGAAEFDHALVMRDIEHEWHAAPDLACR